MFGYSGPKSLFRVGSKTRLSQSKSFESCFGVAFWSYLVFFAFQVVRAQHVVDCLVDIQREKPVVSTLHQSMNGQHSVVVAAALAAAVVAVTETMRPSARQTRYSTRSDTWSRIKLSNDMDGWPAFPSPAYTDTSQAHLGRTCWLSRRHCSRRTLEYRDRSRH